MTGLLLASILASGCGDDSGATCDNETDTAACEDGPGPGETETGGESGASDGVEFSPLDGCVPVCAADTDVVFEGLQPLCRVTQTVGEETGTVQPCVDGVPEGVAEVCYTLRSAGDGLSTTCTAMGSNLQVDVVVLPGAPTPSLSILCQESTNAVVDCPNL